MTGRLAPDSTLLPLELREPAGLPLDRHRDAGTAFILGGGLVPDTLSALPPTLTHHHPPLPTLSTQITANTHTGALLPKMMTVLLTHILLEDQFAQSSKNNNNNKTRKMFDKKNQMHNNKGKKRFVCN